MQDIKHRADFEVYLKTFLQSLNLILPNPAVHPFRGAARRFGYLLRMVKERYKTTRSTFRMLEKRSKRSSMSTWWTLASTRRSHPSNCYRMISSHTLTSMRKATAGPRPAKMEHAIRKHCTVHFDEDPAFYKKLSEKLERLIEQHRDSWDALADDLEQLRKEAIEGRRETVEGLTKEATTFYDHVLQLAYDGGEAPNVDRTLLKKLMLRIVEMLQDTIDVLDFWKKPCGSQKAARQHWYGDSACEYLGVERKA